MKVGDYVRTKDYGIKKISSFYVFDDVENIIADDKFYYTQFPKGEIIGESKENIIDLIEVGDYVNGEKVVDFMLNNNLRAGVIVDSSHYGYDFDEIKSIVTKEQFESMEYKL